MRYAYNTRGVCASQIIVDMDGDTVNSVQFIGGCNGNAKGIASLVSGMKAEEVIRRLKSITCGSKSTSCPDQLASALLAILEKEKKS